MPSPVAFSLNRDDALGVDLDTANHRVQQIAKQLGPAILELSTYIAEGRAMMFGHTFGSGGELAAFLESVVLSEVAFLMEKGLLAKRLPKGAGKGNPEDDKGYL